MGFRMMNMFDLGWPLNVEGQGQTPKNFEIEYLENGTR